MRFSGRTFSLAVCCCFFISVWIFKAVVTPSIHDVSIAQYVLAENRDTQLVSRKWMMYAFLIEKLEQFTLPEAARFYAYTASAYADMYTATKDSIQASIGTADIINLLIPTYQDKTRKFLFHVTNGKDCCIDPITKGIVNRYADRMTYDRFNIQFDGVYPKTKGLWQPSDANFNEHDVMAGLWRYWGDSHFTVHVPDPPQPSSITGLWENELVRYRTVFRTPKDSTWLAFWFGVFRKNADDSVSPISLAGIWQNILFVESGPGSTDEVYAEHQKVLAQTLADASIAAWDVKFRYWRNHPSHEIPKLAVNISDPETPSYVSEQIVLSSAASRLLASLYPRMTDKMKSLLLNIEDTMAGTGVYFPSDISVGDTLGHLVAETHGLKDSKLSLEQKGIFPNPIRIIIELIDIVSMKSRIAFRHVPDITGKILSYNKLFKKPMFQNVIAASGLPTDGSISGASWNDYDNDGLLDLFIAGSDKYGNRLYKNLGNGKFEDVTVKSHIAPYPKALFGVWGDYNNDGCADLFLTRSESNERGKEGILEAPTLYRNNCNGTFTDVTRQAGFTKLAHMRGAAWGDFDNDGYPDLYIANQGDVQSKNYKPEPNFLYHNNGDGTFTEIGEKAGVAHGTNCYTNEVEEAVLGLKTLPIGLWKESFQPIWFDYNNDGKMDLFVTNDFSISILYKNNGDGTFTDVTDPMGMCILGTGMGATVTDYDGDGYLDLYVTNVMQNYLWHNNKGRSFTEVGDLTGVNRYALGWGTEFMDVDNDGYPDLYVANGIVVQQDIRSHIPTTTDFLYRQSKNGIFTEISDYAGMNGNEPKGSAAVADFDNDGFPDIFIASDYKDEKEPPKSHRLYKNLGNSNHWITVKLKGKKSNRMGIGSIVSLRADGHTQTQIVTAGSSFLSQKSPWLTFGIGKAKSIDSLEIRWPSGIAQHVNNIVPDTITTITENGI